VNARTAIVVLVALVLVSTPSGAASPTWSVATQVSAPDRALVPELATNPAGDALAVWDQEVGSVCPTDPAALACVHIVTAATRMHGAGGWSAPLEIRRPGIGSRPRAGIDPNGNAAILLVHDIGADRVVQASFRRGFGGQWPEPNDLSESVHEVRAHDVALDASGNVVAAWAERTDTGVVIEAESRDAASGVWGAPVRLWHGGNVTGGPALAVTPAGEAVAAWVEDGTVRVASGQAASGSWNGAVVIPASDPATGDPDLAVNPAGDGVVVWSASGSVRAAFRPHGSGWSAAATVAPLSGAPDAHARVGIDAAGNAVAVWVAGSVRSAARMGTAGTWSATVALTAAGASEPDVAVNPAGDAVAVWVGATTHWLRSGLRPAASGIWRRKVNLSLGPNATSPRVAIDAGGNAVALWDRNPAGTAIGVESAELRASGPFLAQLVIPPQPRAGVSSLYSVTPIRWTAPLVGKPTWRFGDGKTVSAFRVTRAYARAGRYTVTISATDAAGGTSTTGATVVVQP
jgi:hypothetical protein